MTGAPHETLVVLLRDHPEWLRELVEVVNQRILPADHRPADATVCIVDPLEVRLDFLFEAVAGTSRAAGSQIDWPTSATQSRHLTSSEGSAFHPVALGVGHHPDSEALMRGGSRNVERARGTGSHETDARSGTNTPGASAEAAPSPGFAAPARSPVLSLPKSGGAIRGVDEKFAANPVTGAGSMSVPIFTSPGRSGFGPQLSLAYDSGSGNGPFGLGWGLSVASITRKTEKGLPRYLDADDSDVFLLSGAEDLVPVYRQDADGTWVAAHPGHTRDAEGAWVRDAAGRLVEHEDQVDGYRIRRYRPRIEGPFARIERWSRVGDPTDVHWRSLSKENVLIVYGVEAESRIADPSNLDRIFTWLISEARDDRGNAILYRYKAEDGRGVDEGAAHERNRGARDDIRRTAQRYLKRIHYGNRKPLLDNNGRRPRFLDRAQIAAQIANAEWMFEVVLDYGDHRADVPGPRDDEAVDAGGHPLHPWPRRPDPLSSYRSGFEVRTARRCRRVLMFHHFPGTGPSVGVDCLVRSTDLTYSDDLAPADPRHPAYTFLRRVTQAGYRRRSGAGYDRRALPPVEFEYSEPDLHGAVETVDGESLVGLPVGLDGDVYRWVDLHGEGIPGVLTEQGGQWLYKRNLSPLPSDATAVEGPRSVRFARPETVSRRPHASLGSGAQFMDLAGDGRSDVVLLEGPQSGLYEHDEAEGWGAFQSFTSNLHRDLRSPNVRFVDLDGDGIADVLITEDDALIWHASMAEAGFGPARRVVQALDEERGPRVVFADGTQSIYLADLSGDGLADLVRIRNGAVCYWPNLGYGRFGPKITMDRAPLFDHPDRFDQARVRLSDVDGSGTADIIYLHREGARVYFNQSGNAWGEPQTLDGFPQMDDLASVAAIDLLGNGTTCLVWSSPFANDPSRPMRYVNLMGGQKPHLLVRSVNNLGAETRVRYAPSTRFYLEDKRRGTPWVTRLPFPVQVIERVEVIDHVSRHRFVTRYAYHHGYFDGPEREFRGFGMVEQWDTEAFVDYVAGVQEIGGLQGTEPEFFQPPVTTRTWYHTGAFLDGERLLQQYQRDYYQQESLFPDAGPGGADDAEEAREQARALKGLPLRQEVYSFDGSPNQEHPYLVRENRFEVQRLQSRGAHRHGIYLPVGRESVTRHQERDPADPRVTHQLVLDLDDLGNPLRTCSVVYGRQVVDPGLPVEVSDDQRRRYVTCVETDYTPDIDRGAPTETHRLRAVYESRSFEVTSVAPGGARFRLDELRDAVDGATPIDYEVVAGGPSAQRRTLSRARALFLDDALQPLPLGQWDTLGLLHQGYQLALTPNVVAAHYAGAVSNADFVAAGYVTQPDVGGWWIPSGTAIYPPNPRARFHIPIGARSPFGVETVATFDGYDLLVEKVEVRQATWNVVTAINDYRTLGPVLITDANQNRAAVELDELGMVVKTALMGKAGAGEGDTLDDPTTRLEYELFRWMDHRQPNFVRTFAREQHGGGNPRWQESYAYSNGSGGVVLVKGQAAPGKAYAVGQDGQRVEVDADPRWIGNGRTVLNNKGRPIKQYEPYFSVTHEYEDEAVVRELGVTPLLSYDPVGRNVRTDFPDGTLARVEFTPWRQRAFDANDAVQESRWYVDRGSPDPAAEPEPLNDPQRRAAWLAARHAGTPGAVHLDSLGRPVYVVSDHGGGTTAAVRSVTDLTGRLSSTFDQQQRLVASGFVGMAGALITGESAERGRRWSFQDITGAAVKTWDEHGRELRVEFDGLRRPLSTFVRHGGGAEVLFSHVVYGDRLADAVPRNLLGVAHLIFDQAGVTRVPSLDFKGNPTAVERTLARDYKGDVDWSGPAALADPADVEAAAAAALEAEVFRASSRYDALSRPTEVTLPDDTVMEPTYDLANRLASLRARVRGKGPWVEFLKGQEHNARGQRTRARYGNEVFTEQFHDPQTFRLARLLTYRSGADPDTQALQDLRYVHDAVGNLAQVSDEAQQTHYFGNGVVRPESLYEYDAVYQLVRATGRELKSLANDSVRTHADLEFVPSLPHANDAAAVRRYTEEYEYDLLGNLKTLKHRHRSQLGVGGGWTRHYRYAFDDTPGDRTNRLTATSLPGDVEGGPLSGTYGHDDYGNMTRMPHLPVMDWTFMDQLRRVDLGGGGEAFYNYGVGGQRLRKVVERSGSRLEWIFLGAVMIFRRRRLTTGELRLERKTVHIGDEGGAIAQVDTKTRDDDGEDPSNALGVPLVRYQYSNHLGSASLETDASGQPVSYEEYHPFGTTAYWSSKPGHDTKLRRFRFSGKEQDDETGLYYFGARYYAPWLGRWTSSDPAGFVDGFNLYRYCKNTPVMLVDPLGTTPESSDNVTVVQRMYFTGNESLDDLRNLPVPAGHQFDPSINESNYRDYYIPKSDSQRAGGVWAVLIPAGSGPAPDASSSEPAPAPPASPPADYVPVPRPPATSGDGSSDSSGSTWNRVVGGIQLAGGVLEGVLAVGLLLTPEPTMATKVGGGVLAVHSLDTIVAGARTLWTGEVKHTLTHEAGAGAARAAGASESTAQWVGTGADIAASLGPTAAVGVSRRLAVAGAENLAQGGKASILEVLEGAGVKVGSYTPTGKIIAQETAETCVAASCRMIASDAGVLLSEESAAVALNTTENGASVLASAEVLESLGVSGGQAFRNATAAQLEAGLASGKSAIVGVNVPGVGGHAMVVDRIAGATVYLRDPLPVAQGSSFAMPLKDFLGFWKGRMVTF